MSGHRGVWLIADKQTLQVYAEQTEDYEQEELEAILTEQGFRSVRHWTGFAKGLAAHKEGWLVLHAEA